MEKYEQISSDMKSIIDTMEKKIKSRARSLFIVDIEEFYITEIISNQAEANAIKPKILAYMDLVTHTFCNNEFIDNDILGIVASKSDIVNEDDIPSIKLFLKGLILDLHKNRLGELGKDLPSLMEYIDKYIDTNPDETIAIVRQDIGLIQFAYYRHFADICDYHGDLSSEVADVLANLGKFNKVLPINTTDTDKLKSQYEEIRNILDFNDFVGSMTKDIDKGVILDYIGKHKTLSIASNMNGNAKMTKAVGIVTKMLRHNYFVVYMQYIVRMLHGNIPCDTDNMKITDTEFNAGGNGRFDKILYNKSTCKLIDKLRHDSIKTQLSLNDYTIDEIVETMRRMTTHDSFEFMVDMAKYDVCDFSQFHSTIRNSVKYAIDNSELYITLEDYTINCTIVGTAEQIYRIMPESNSNLDLNDLHNYPCLYILANDMPVYEVENFRYRFIEVPATKSNTYDIYMDMILK